jgi:hypothetical protein
MSIVEKRSASHSADYEATDETMPATTSVCVALVVALLLYMAGTAVLQRDAVTGAPQQTLQSEMSFHGP